MLIYSTDGNDLELTFEPDYYELRLDLRKKTFEIPALLRGKKNTIITIRDIVEQGQYRGRTKKKILFLASILHETDFFVDIELQHLEDILGLIEEKHHSRLIISCHNNSDCSLRKHLQKIKEMKKISCFFYKFVFYIPEYAHFFVVLQALQKKEIAYCFFTYGHSAFLSRILYKHCGSKAVYFGKKEKETAAEQITEYDVQRYNLLNITAQTRLGGIIGDQKVHYSLGLSYYNQYFQQNNCDAIYIPFPINPIFLGSELYLKEVEDLIQLAYRYPNLFYGFSITSPFKSWFPICLLNAAKKKEQREVKVEFISEQKKIVPSLTQQAVDLRLPHMINLWIPRTNKQLLTDEHAFMKSFHQLEITPKTPIILVGRGAMAKKAIDLLRTNTIYWLNDNDHWEENSTHKKLRRIHEYDPTYDTCLINATPVTRLLDLLRQHQIHHFNKVIDLPYSTQPTEIISYCQNNNLRYVDGYQFWEWQSENQLVEFLQEMRVYDV